MPMSLSAPAQISGDIKLIKSEEGTTSTGADSAIEVSSCTIPGLTKDKTLIIYVAIARVTGAENCLIGTHLTTATIASGRPGYFSGANSSYGAIVNINAAIETAGTADWQSQNFVGGSLTYVVNNANLGTITTAKTLYLNIQQRATSTYKWKWFVYVVGEGVKG